MHLKHRFWAQYTAGEFAKLDHKNLVAVLPVGAIEQHGPHLPLSVDQAIVDGLVNATLPYLPDDSPVLFLPTLPIDKSNEHSAWPGTLTFSAQTIISMWMEIGDSVATAGGGKSNALKMIAGLLPVSAGTITITPSDGEAEHDLAFVFQEPTLMPWATVFDAAFGQDEISFGTSGLAQGGPQVNNRPILAAERLDFLMAGNLLLTFDSVRNEIPVTVVAAYF